MGTTVLAAIAAVLLMATGCQSNAPTPRLGSEETYDGLVRVEDARRGRAWIARDFDLSRYSKVKLEGIGIQYRADDLRNARLDSQEFFGQQAV